MDRQGDSDKQPVHVPAEQLSPEALKGLIEEFVTRSGTDYGRREASLAEKCLAIQKQLASKKAVIVYEPSSQSVTIVSSEDIQPPGTYGQKKGAP